MFKNLAGNKDADSYCKTELAIAKINIEKYEFLRAKREVPTAIVGQLGDWTFERAWYYWSAKGPGVSVEDAEKLHSAHGDVVRVDGHCGCPNPREHFKGFGVGLYHIDSQDGLCALADTIRTILNR